MNRQKLELARADFELACKERQKKRPCTNDMCEECELKIAIECIDKQIPKNPKYAHHCPSCELGLPAKGLSNEYCGCCFKWNFCPFCGQAIDWSEENETP